MRVAIGAFGAALAALALMAAAPSPALAQGFGINSILNPEGSRLFPQSAVYPRHPGKPDPRWKSFEWRYADRDVDGVKYRLYFYESEEWAASFTLPRIERQAQELKRKFGYTPTTKFDYTLFTSLREFQQANIFFISEGVRGITSTEEATMAIPYTGQRGEFDHVSLHEMVHQFQVQKIRDLAKIYAPEALASFPLWFIEGMAEFYSQGSGIDRETRMYIRDLLLNPKKDQGHEMPGLFDSGPLNFIMVYKVGQAKIDFFETEFGEGTAQKLLESLARSAGGVFFAPQAEKVLGVKAEELEKRWRAYLERFKASAPEPAMPLEKWEAVKEAGDTLDHFVVSPDGKVLALRRIDPLTGVSSIRVLDLDNGRKGMTAAQDDKPDTLSLYFFEVPAMALSNDTIAYAVETTSGPEIELKTVRREGKKIVLEDFRRIPIHEHGIIQASNLALHEDGRLAFVGLSSNGWENVYVVTDERERNKGRHEMTRLTDSYYGWRGLSWSRLNGRDVLIGSSDRTSTGAYNLFSIDPAGGAIRRVTVSDSDETSPEFLSEGDGGRYVFRSWASGSSQIHSRADGRETRLTAADTLVDYPAVRGDYLYVLGYRSGRYHLFRRKTAELASVPVAPAPEFAAPVAPVPQPLLPIKPEAPHAIGGLVPVSGEPWRADTINLADLNVEEYKPFRSSGIRLSNFGAFLSSGGVAGVAGVASDLMRNYQIQGEFFFLGDFALSTADVFVSSQKGRATWTLGGYHIAQRRLDSIFMSKDEEVRTYIHREFGGLGAVQYPLGAYSYIDLEMRIAGVERREFSDPELRSEWNELNPGSELLLAPMLRLGYDRILYEAVTGPIKGHAILFESDMSYFPARKEWNQRFRIDAAGYVQVVKRTVLAVQGLAGLTLEGLYRNPFFLSSEDFLRAYPFGDDRLYGNYVLAARGELRFPIGESFGFPYLRGLVGYDVGAVFNRAQDIQEKTTTSYTTGLLFNIPPISLGLLFSWPGQLAPGPAVSYPVLHFTLRYLYL